MSIKQKRREEIPSKYKWRLEDIYENEEIWEQEFELAKTVSQRIANYKGKLSKSASHLYNCLKDSEKLSLLIQRLFTYAKMRRDEDNRNSLYQGLTDRALSLSVQLGSETSFITPEILKISEEQLEQFIKEEPKLEQYRIMLERVMKRKPHILSEEMEELLAKTGDMADSPSTTYDMLTDADLKFPTIKDENGNKVELTQSNFITFMKSSNREVRKAAFEALYKTFGQFQNTIASTLSSNVKSNIFYSSVRKYNSVLESALKGKNIPISVYTNLIDTVHKKLEPMYRYMELRKKALKLDDLHMYDIYAPFIKEESPVILYEDAYDTVVKSLSVLGEDYTNVLKEAYHSRWIDVYSNEGKSSGAYHWGPFGTHPYVLLNHKDDLNSMFTIAHEMGHAMHSYYSKRTQPYTYAHYTIFVAEVASTVNEALLMQYLLKNATDKKTKILLINYFLEQFRTTLYRQTMFAEFEKIIHDKAENKEPLTAEVFNTIYKDLNKLYYGDNVVIDDEISLEWARIPHFYNSFYVYQYATGYSAAMALSKQILEEGQPAVKRYLNFLSSGSSKYPIDLLKDAGVDMSSPQPIEDALDIFDDLVNQMEKLLEEE